MDNEHKRCKFCGEEILAVAIKCKHCHSMLNEDNNEIHAVTNSSNKENAEQRIIINNTQDSASLNTALALTQTKNKALAIVLSIVFGPFGLLYATVSGGMWMLFVGLIIMMFATATLGLGIVLLIPYNIACVIWSCVAVDSHNSRIIKELNRRATSSSLKTDSVKQCFFESLTKDQQGAFESLSEEKKKSINCLSDEQKKVWESIVSIQSSQWQRLSTEGMKSKLRERKHVDSDIDYVLGEFYSEA